MSKKVVIRIVLCSLLFLGMIGYLSCVFTFPRGETSDMARERFNTFYAQPKNTMDAVYIGSSGVDRYWIPPAAWNDYGVAVYDFTSGNQPTVFTKYIIEETLKYQDVKLFIIDIRGVMRKPEDINDTDIRRVTDNLRFSSTKIKATNAALNYVAQGDTKIDTDDISYYFSLLKYHSRWNGSLKPKDWTELFPETEYMGYFAYNSIVFKQKPQVYPKLTTKKSPIPKTNEAVLLDLLEYCNTLDANILFVSSPQSMSEEEQTYFNYVFDLIQSKGFETMNFNTKDMYSKIGWDFKSDMYNESHANIFGALKYTEFLGDYIQNKYQLANHKADAAEYKNWDKSYKDLLERVKEKDYDLYSEMIHK